MTGILFRKSNLQPSSALMDQRTEKLCCTGSCMYSMSNIACLKKMGIAEKINTRPLLSSMSVGSDFQSTPPAMEPNFLLQGAELLLVSPEGITPLDLFANPTANYWTFHHHSCAKPLPFSSPFALTKGAPSIKLIWINQRVQIWPSDLQQRDGFLRRGRRWGPQGAQTENTSTARLMGYWKYSFVKCELFTYRCCEKRHRQPLAIKG